MTVTAPVPASVATGAARRFPMTATRCLATLLGLALATALPGVAKDKPTVKLGQTAAQVEAALGQPSWTQSKGARRTLGFTESKVVLVNDKVTEIHRWQSCEAQGRADEPGCETPSLGRWVQVLPAP